MGGGVRVKVYSLFFSRDVFVSPKITHFKQLSVAQSWRIGFILINQKPHKFGEFGWDEAYSSIMICNPRIIKWSPPGQHLPIHWPPLPGKKHTYLENNCNFGTTMKRKKDAEVYIPLSQMQQEDFLHFKRVPSKRYVLHNMDKGGKPFLLREIHSPPLYHGQCPSKPPKLKIWRK